MIIVAGDSFVYGSELANPANTFPCLLAGNYKNVSWPGYGNDSIARSTIEACENNTVTGVIVSWTFPGRYEFRFNYDTRQHTGNWYTITPWTTQSADNIKKEFVTDNEDILNHHVDTTKRAKETGVADFATSFYKHVGSSEYWEIYSSLKEIVYLQNYLKLKQIPYLFTCADNVLIYNNTIRDADSIIGSLTKQLDFSNWFWFPPGNSEWETNKPRGFYQWALENKYPVGTTHPLDEAHKDAALLMQEKFNEMVKKLI